MNFLYLTRFYLRNGWTIKNAVNTAWKVCRYYD
jgi:hypothetical protein